MAITVVRKARPRIKGNLRASAGGYLGYQYTAGASVLGEYSQEYLIKGIPNNTLPPDILILAGNAGLPMPGQPVGTESESRPFSVGSILTSDWVVGHVEISDLEAYVYNAQNMPDISVFDCHAIAHFVPNPIRLPIEIHIQTTHYKKVVLKDTVTGKIIANSAGDPFDPPPERDYPRMRIEIVRRFSLQTITPEIIAQSCNRVNSHYFMGFDPGMVYLADIRAPLVQEPCWHNVVTFQFEVDPTNTTETGGVTVRGWQQKFLDSGRHYKDNNGKKVVFPDAFGRLHGHAGLLDGTGKKLADGADPKYLAADTIEYFDFNTIPIFA